MRRRFQQGPEDRDGKVPGCHGYPLTVWPQTDNLASLSLGLGTKHSAPGEHRGPLEQEGGLSLAPSQTPQQKRSPSQRRQSPSPPKHTPPGFKHLSKLRFNLGELRSSAVQNSSAEEAAFGE